jgi:hypothetical protein
MMATHEARGRGVVHAVLERAGSMLLQAAEDRRVAPAATVVPVRPVVAAVALAPRCGGSTLARALAVELGRRDPARAAAVCGPSGPSSMAIPTSSAGRLGRALEPFADDGMRTAGRLCLLDAVDPAPLVAASKYAAPLVIDVRHGEPAGRPVALADHVVLVAGPDVEPALAEVVAASLARIGPEPLIAVTRVIEPGAWGGRGALLLPESRVGARLALAGREARGGLGSAIAELADLCERL